MLGAKFSETYSAVGYSRIQMFSPFLFLDVFHVALLVCKFSDILNMSLSNGKHVQKNKGQMKL